MLCLQEQNPVVDGAHIEVGRCWVDPEFLSILENGSDSDTSDSVDLNTTNDSTDLNTTNDSTSTSDDTPNNTGTIDLDSSMESNTLVEACFCKYCIYDKIGFQTDDSSGINEFKALVRK